MIRTRGAGRALGPSPWCLGFLLLALTGCALQGPRATGASRLAYNEAVRSSDQRELLLNLVRLRYTEAPEFLAISGISTQMRFDASASLSAELVDDGADLALVSPGAAIGYSESPTITFLPQRDKDFTQQLVAPVELETLYLLSRYGWGLDRILLLIASEVNGIANSLSREAETSRVKELRRFRELVASLRQLETERLISIDAQRRRDAVSPSIPADLVSAGDILSAAKDGYRLEYREQPASYVLTEERTHFILAVDREGWERSELDSLVRELGVPPRRQSYEIDSGYGPSGDAIRLVTRSVLGTMAYLSNAVSVPAEHAELTAPSDGTADALGALLKVHVSPTPVDHAYLAVQHRGHWFYIDDRDLESKRTMGLLTSLVRLTLSAGGAQNVPILTLPVSR